MHSAKLVSSQACRAEEFGGERCTRAHLPIQIITPACISAVSAWGPAERRVGGSLSKQRAERNGGARRSVKEHGSIQSCRDMLTSTTLTQETKPTQIFCDLLLAPHMEATTH